MSFLRPVNRVLPARVKSAVRRWLDAPPRRLRRLRDQAAGRCHFEIDILRVNPDRVELAGWVAGPPELLADPRPLLNGGPFATQRSLERPDVLADLPYAGSRRAVAAVGIHAAIEREVAAGEWVEIRVTDGPGGKTLGRPVRDYLPHPTEPWPDAVHRRRVHGGTDPDTFRRVGATAFAGLRDGLRAVTGKNFADFPRVLDWGCGCGRVTRHFAGLPVAVTGVDVDTETVGWCREHLTGTFRPIPLHPPTDLPSASFDLAIGVSIFTHLTEPVQFEWLAELRRLVRPGGVLLMTVHGEGMAAANPIPGPVARSLFARGFYDFPNRVYDAALAETDYYRNTLHTAGYVRREWGKFFDVLDVLPCHIGRHDLVVLRRP
jgi:SAM-dependent methyltransferase